MCFARHAFIGTPFLPAKSGAVEAGRPGANPKVLFVKQRKSKVGATTFAALPQAWLRAAVDSARCLAIDGMVTVWWISQPGDRRIVPRYESFASLLLHRVRTDAWVLAVLVL